MNQNLQFIFPAFTVTKYQKSIMFHVIVKKDLKGIFYSAWFADEHGSPSFDLKFENGSWYERFTKLDTWELKKRTNFASNIGGVIESTVNYFGYKRFFKN